MMIDKEKVIDGQKEIIMYLLRMSEMCSEDDEPYYDKLRDYAINTLVLLANLLKEQEPVRPIAKKEMDEITSYLETVYYCGNCYACLPLYKEYNIFCPKCGRKVKWE